MTNPTATPWLLRHFGAVVAAVVLAKLLLAWWLPLTGDEAYFVQWGRHPDYGYYDHPPMVGWWLSLLLLFGDSVLWLRLPGIVATLLPAALLYWLFRREDPQQAKLLALLALFLPLFLVGVLVTTDTPLIVLGLLATVAMWQGVRSGGAGWFLLGGVLLGLAFLSKYFAALLGIALLLHVLLFERTRWRGVLLVVAGALPAIALNLYWNQQHCWYNLMFNLVNRHGDDGGGLANVPVYLGTLAYLFTPWLLWFLWRQRDAVLQGVRARRLGLFLSMALVPLAVFLLLSSSARIGLHWLAVFAPPLLVAAFFLPADALRRSANGMALFGLAHLLPVLLLLALPVELLKEQRRYADAVFYLEPAAVAATFAGYGDDVALFTGSYSRSAMLSYYAGRHVGVLGDGSHYGRQDDLLTDFRALDGGRVVLLLRRGEAELPAWQPYFRELRLRTVTVAGASFHLLEGEGFDYARYREQVLVPVRERYYAFPDWLPPCECAFVERYFGAAP